MNEFSQTLKSWRQTRRYSQLDLAVEAEVSSRHISFLETGRSKPSREMIDRLGDALQLPLAAKNQMLNLAGFAARYPARKWDSEEMKPVREAITYTLQNHEPYPAIAVDRLWNIVQMNTPAALIYGELGIKEGGSLLEMLRSDQLRDRVENWPDVAHHAMQRLRTESASQGGISELEDLADYLARTPASANPSPLPVVPTVFNSGTIRLSLFATIAQFGTPEDLLLDDMKIELFFPADEETRKALETASKSQDFK